jgi:SAM-dependent methyltransferase
MAWYKEWFNSEEYLKVYKHRDSAEAEDLVSLIQKNFNLSRGSSVLDMACGAGRHAIAFARRGFAVTAVDLSERLISEARDNTEESKVEINFIQSDIRDLNLSLHFDLAVNLFTSFGYFETDEENLEVIQKAYDLVNLGGFFVLDYLNKHYLVKNLIPSSKMRENGTTIIQNRTIRGNRVEKKITIEKDDVITDFYESVRLYDFTELKDILESKGFQIRKLLGDFNGNDFDESSSSRTIIFAQK